LSLGHTLGDRLPSDGAQDDTDTIVIERWKRVTRLLFDKHTSAVYCLIYDKPLRSNITRVRRGGFVICGRMGPVMLAAPMACLMGGCAMSFLH
jgi:hypothetical protein